MVDQEEYKIPSPATPAWRFGLITGIIMALMSWATTLYSAKSQVVLPFYVEFVFVAILITGVALAILAFRRSFTTRMMRYPEGLGCGLLTSFFVAIILALFTFLFFYLDEGTRSLLINLQKKNSSPEDLKMIEENLQSGQEGIMLTFLALSTFLKYLIYGIFGSLIIPLFLFKSSQQ